MASVRDGNGGGLPCATEIGARFLANIETVVRGVFRGTTSLRPDRAQGVLKVLRATGDLSEASFAVRTQSGKPVAFGTVNATGKARLFTAPGCVAD